MSSEHQPDARDLRIAELERKVGELEAELRERRSATRNVHTLERELDRAIGRLRDQELALSQARRDVTKLRNRRALRIANAVGDVLRAPSRMARERSRDAIRSARVLARQLGIGKALRALGLRGAREATVTQDRVRHALPPPPAASGSVTVLVEARSGPEMLRRCLVGLQQTDWPELEVLVIGPDAHNSLRWATRGDQRANAGRRYRSVGGESIPDARREALAIASGELILLLHDDVHAIEPTWLARMVGALRETAAGAVGARLLAPPGGGRSNGRSRGPSVAHLGLEFDSVDGFPSPMSIGSGLDPFGQQSIERRERPATSQACLLIERAVLDAVGMPRAELDDAEPVELCLRLREAGRPIVVEGSAALWHRNAAKEAARRIQPGAALGGLGDRWGPRLYRSVLLDRLRGEGRWSSAPLRVGITLTKDEEAAGYGDWYTAHELGGALEELGWTVSYLERWNDAWYEQVLACDVVVSLLERFDLFRVPRHVISIAWIRNWTEEWTAKPWFANYDIVLVSSGRSKELVEEQSAKVAHLFPIATNPDRFHPRPPTPELESDVAFVGSHWGVQRGVTGALTQLADWLKVAVYGRGWEDVPGMRELSRGMADYATIADIYASTSIAIDDAAVSTKPYGSVNSRVFDALATGTLVLTDNASGVRELFDDEFPTWRDEADLVTQVDEWLGHPDRRAAVAARYRQVVLDRHTYRHRARRLRELLVEWTSAVKVGAHIGPLTWEAGRTWGDVPFGRDVQRQLERRGHPTALLVHAEADSAAALRTDVALHIFGVRAPRNLESQLNALWVISHPDHITESLVASYDLVFIASDMLLEHLASRVSVPLVPLHQATEPARFHPDPTGPHHQLLFIGNSRRVRRPIIEDLQGTDYDLAVYGSDWDANLLDPKHLRGEWVSNDELRRYYSSADIVLNDHWGDMRDLGIISNRIYDALACGAFVVSDRVPGIDEEFDGAVATYETREELLALLDRYLPDEAARRAAGERGRAAVLARHTFSIRVDRILGELGPMLAERALVVDAAPGSVAARPAPDAASSASGSHALLTRSGA